MRKCIFVSEEGFRVPSNTVPSRESLTSISSVMAPFETPVGVTHRALSPTRTDRLPVVGGHQSPLINFTPGVQNFRLGLGV